MVTPAPKTTLVTTAEGDVTEFAGVVSKFAAAHPKTALILAAVIAFAAGWIVHVH